MAPRGLFFVRNNDTYPNGVLHILRETRAQRRVKVGTDLGRPIFSDERDPNIADHRSMRNREPGVPGRGQPRRDTA
jgi:hypothetical protein